MGELHAKRVQFSHVRVKRVQFSHVRVFSDSRNVQKSVTQIIYLGPLPTHHFGISLCSEDELWEISCKDIATDSKTMSSANIVDTVLEEYQQYAIYKQKFYINIDSNIQ